MSQSPLEGISASAASPSPRRYMPNTGKSRYLITDDTLKDIKAYQQSLADGGAPGKKLLVEINHFLNNPNQSLTSESRQALRNMPPADFLQLVMNTREPTVLAEEQKVGPEEKWNEEEYGILSNIYSVIEDVEVYDNGKWGTKTTPKKYENPHTATLLCVPGAILNQKAGHTIDRKKLLDNGEPPKIDPEKFKAEYKKKLIAVFQQANDSAAGDNTKAFITVPGIGDGAFAGEFKETTIPHLHSAIEELLTEHPEWKNIGCVWLDGFKTGNVSNTKVLETTLRLRQSEGENGENKLISGAPYSSLAQLSKASEFAETQDEKAEFEGMKRFKIVAWDPFSYEGNDVVGGIRNTDEANLAACNGLEILSGTSGRYVPPKGYSAPLDSTQDRATQQEITWKGYFEKHNIKQSIADRLYVRGADGTFALQETAAFKSSQVPLPSTLYTAREALDSEQKKSFDFIAAGVLQPNNNPINPERLTEKLQDMKTDPKLWATTLTALKHYAVARAPENQNLIGHRFSQIETVFNTYMKGIFAKVGYKYGDNLHTRTHDFPATLKTETFKKDFGDLKGDPLKRAILENFKEKLNACVTDKEVANLVNQYKNPQGMYHELYQILSTPQDKQMWKRTTDSVKDFNQLVGGICKGRTFSCPQTNEIQSLRESMQQGREALRPSVEATPMPNRSTELGS